MTTTETFTGTVLRLRQEPDRFVGAVDILTIDTDERGEIDIRMSGAWRLPVEGQRIRIRAKWQEPPAACWLLKELRKAERGQMWPVFEEVEPVRDEAPAVEAEEETQDDAPDARTPRDIAVEALRQAHKTLTDAYVSLFSAKVDPGVEMGALGFATSVIDLQVRQWTSAPAAAAKALREVVAELAMWESCVDDAEERRDNLIRQIFAWRKADDVRALGLDIIRLQALTGLSKARIYQIKNNTR